MLHPGRGLARLLVILAVLAAVVAAVAGWARGVVLEEEGWRSASEELVAQPAVRAALAEHLAGEITEAVRVPPRVVAALPGAGESRLAVERRLAEAFTEVLERPGVQAALLASMVEAHSLAAEALRGGGPRVDAAGGVVALDLDGVLRAGLAEIEGGQRLARLIPQDLGRVEIVDAADLEPAQVAVDRVETAARFAPLVAIALLALALVVAGSGRRGVLMLAGVLGLVAGVGLILLRAGIGALIVEALADEPQYREAADRVWEIVSDGLGTNGLVLAFIGGGLLLASVAYGVLAGAARRTGGAFGGGGGAAGGAEAGGGWSIGGDARGDATAQRMARARQLYEGGAITEAEYHAEVQRIRDEA